MECGDFAETTAFERYGPYLSKAVVSAKSPHQFSCLCSTEAIAYGVKTSEKANMDNEMAYPDHVQRTVDELIY